MLRRLPLIRQPLFWGTLGFLGFYALIDRGVLKGGLVERYFASHPVEYVTTALFFVGLAALAIKWIELTAQFGKLKKTTLGSVPTGGQRPEQAAALLEHLAGQSAGQEETYLVRRLREALDYVRRKLSATDMDEHLRYLADLDIDRMQSSYALVRVVVWAVPILGFLGTVVGITMAIAKLSPDALESSLPEVTAGLGIAFDTTALALTLSILLMFAKFFVERVETRLLGAVDRRVAEELVGRFRDFGSTAEPHLAAVRQIAEKVLEASGTLLERQTQLWRSTLDAAHREWSGWMTDAGAQLESRLTTALGTALKEHAAAVRAGETALADVNRRHWDRLLQTVEASTATVAEQQGELVKQGQVFREIVEATGQLERMETALNGNLAALAGAKNFEDTVMSLAAAIQLLSGRLGHPAEDKRRVQLPSCPSPSASSAA